MRYFRSICFSLVLFVFFTALIFSQNNNQEKTEEKQPPVGLIRKDLLSLDIKKLDPPKRNIFTPNSAGLLEIEKIENINETQQGGQQNSEDLKGEVPFVRALGLRYIGYVKSGQKITALILFEGEALAVDVGEEIAESVSISKITLEDITVIGPDNEPQTFPLEGATL
jgi:hypothetical protein